LTGVRVEVENGLIVGGSDQLPRATGTLALIDISAPSPFPVVRDRT
jgi:hypothetical protein